MTHQALLAVFNLFSSLNFQNPSVSYSCQLRQLAWPSLQCSENPCKPCPGDLWPPGSIHRLHCRLGLITPGMSGQLPRRSSNAWAPRSSNSQSPLPHFSNGCNSCSQPGHLVQEKRKSKSGHIIPLIPDHLESSAPHPTPRNPI